MVGRGGSGSTHGHRGGVGAVTAWRAGPHADLRDGGTRGAGDSQELQLGAATGQNGLVTEDGGPGGAGTGAEQKGGEPGSTPQLTKHNAHGKGSNRIQPVGGVGRAAGRRAGVGALASGEAMGRQTDNGALRELLPMGGAVEADVLATISPSPASGPAHTCPHGHAHLQQAGIL